MRNLILVLALISEAAMARVQGVARVSRLGRVAEQKRMQRQRIQSLVASSPSSQTLVTHAQIDREGQDLPNTNKKQYHVAADSQHW